MKFKSVQRVSASPEINLTPMIDLVMTILTFFVIVSMTLTTGAGSVKVDLPSGKGQADKADSKQKPTQQIVKVDGQGAVYLVDSANPQAEARSTLEQLEPQIAAFLKQNPTGRVLINADRKLPYEKVIEVLTRLRSVGGDRVSLAFQQN